MAYGEVARMAGYPRYARMVSRSMARSPKTLPWHRVLRSNRTLAFNKGSVAYTKQASLLEAEGVIIENGKVIPEKSDDDLSLDELLWS